MESHGRESSSVDPVVREDVQERDEVVLEFLSLT